MRNTGVIWVTFFTAPARIKHGKGGLFNASGMQIEEVGLAYENPEQTIVQWAKGGFVYVSADRIVPWHKVISCEIVR